MISRWKHNAIQTAIHTAEALSALGEPSPPPDPGDVLVLTAYTPEIAGYGAVTAANKSRYAARHGYACKIHTSGFHPHRPPAWSKILFLQRALRRHRWVFWSDADALIMNPDIRLESLIQPGIDVCLTRALCPHPHINTGHMLFRSCPFSLLFLEAVWHMTAFIHDSSWEQRAINHLWERYRFRRIGIKDNRAFNSYGQVPNDPDPYQPGDFIIHFPGVANKEAHLLRAASPTGPRSP